MLYLNPPYFIIDGVSIFPDHADPLQFYYLPMAPQLTMAADSTGKTTPRIQLIEYEGAAGTGGFINFDVNIGIDPDKLQDVGQQLQQQAQLSGTPRLSPVTFVDGEVKLVILGAADRRERPRPRPPARASSPRSRVRPSRRSSATIRPVSRCSSISMAPRCWSRRCRAKCRPSR
jgi:hypothetical protein